MATIGYRSAVADAFGMKFTRFIGYVMWAFIHVLYLIGWGNRLGTLYTLARASGSGTAGPTASSPSIRQRRSWRRATSRRAGRHRFCPCPQPPPLRPSGTPADVVAAP